MTRTPHLKHLEHRTLERTRRSRRLLNWLDSTATALTTTAAGVFHALRTMSAREVGGLANIDIPTNSVAPAITGTAQVGQVLTVSDGTWAGVPAPTYSYQWNRDGVRIENAVESTYTPVAADVGATLTATVTATNAGGSVSVNSAATAAVIA